MPKPKWITKIQLWDFYDSLTYRCPKCNSFLPIDEDPLYAMACDVMCDRCPDCGTHIIINMFSEESPFVLIEGFPDSEQMEARTTEMIEIYKRRKDA